MLKYRLALSMLVIVVCATSRAALPPGFYSFNGSLLETFDSMGPLGTTPPSGADANPAWIVETPGIVNSLTPRASLNSTTGENWAGVYTGYNGGGLISNDRALGLYRSASGDAATLTTALLNDTGFPISNITLTYDLELWSSRTNNRTGGFGLSYSLNGTSWTAAGGNFTVVLSIPTAPPGTTAEKWLPEPVAQRGIGGTLSLPTAWQANQTLYLRWDNRSGPGIGGSNRNIGSFIDNLAIAAPGLPAPTPPGNETTTSFRTCLATSKPPPEQAALLADPVGFSRKLIAHATANATDISTSPPPLPGISFQSATGLSGVHHSIEITSDLENGPWEEIARFDGSVFTYLHPNAGYEITDPGNGTLSVTVQVDSQFLSERQRLFFRRQVAETTILP